ncbi:hypothetical protein ACVTMO_16710 [Pseudomonas segetis]
MSHNFKPGDLALTLVDRCGVPAMTQVDLVELIEPGILLAQINGRTGKFSYPVWRCSTSLIPEGDLVFRIKELMPLRGDFAPERQKSKEADKCL